jgi:hypothetical protein
VLELDLHLLAQLLVEGPERFVEEEDAGFEDQGAGEGNALALSAGEFVGIAVLEAGEAHEVEGGGDEVAVFTAGELRVAEAEGDVALDGQVRDEGVVLEDEVDGATVGGEGGDVLVFDDDVAGVAVLEAGDHAEEGGLAAAAGAQEGEELAAADVERDVVGGGDVAEVLDRPDHADAVVALHRGGGD